MAFGLQNGVLLARTASGITQSLIYKYYNNKKLVFITKAIDSKGVSTQKENTINFDSIFSWDYNESVQITENPVQEGVKINDHRIINPKKLTINVGVSNIQSITDVQSVADLSNYAQVLLIDGRLNSKSRSAATYQQLATCMYNAEPFNVSTPMGNFNNMLITDISKKQDSESISIFEGTITLQEIKKYLVTKLTYTNKASAKTPTQLGTTQTKTVTGVTL